MPPRRPRRSIDRGQQPAALAPFAALAAAAVVLVAFFWGVLRPGAGTGTGAEAPPLAETDPNAMYAEAFRLYELKRTEESATLFRRYLKLRPRDAELPRVVAICRVRVRTLRGVNRRARLHVMVIERVAVRMLRW